MFRLRPFRVARLRSTRSSRDVVALGYRLRYAASHAAISDNCSKRPGLESVPMVTSARWTNRCERTDQSMRSPIVEAL